MFLLDIRLTVSYGYDKMNHISLGKKGLLVVDVNEITENFTRRPVWALIDLDAAAHNMEQIRELVGPEMLISAVVKANSYGHGSVELAKTFLQHGANRLAVACLDEAVELRIAGIMVKIVILGHTDGRRADELLTYSVDPAVFHYDDAKLFSDAAVRQHRLVNIHIAVDTGMGRIGYQPTEESIAEIKKIAALPHVVMEGCFTHFSVADAMDPDSMAYTKEQFAKFGWFQKRLTEEGVHINHYHCCNSAATLDHPEFYCDMVRPGIIQYGYDPSDEVSGAAYHLEPVMSLCCCVAHVKWLNPGDSVSYGRRFTATRPTCIATLPIGYSDGYSRLLSNKAEVLIHGKRVRQVGSICMDQCMVDVTDIPDVRVGDKVVLFGKDGDAEIPVEEIANLMGTIPYEVTCNINRRIPRVYVRHNKVVRRVEYLLAHVPFI